MANQPMVKVIREPVSRLRPKTKRSSNAAIKGAEAMLTRVRGSRSAKTVPIMD